jgi:hypothetical protein
VRAARWVRGAQASPGAPRTLLRCSANTRKGSGTKGHASSSIWAAWGSPITSERARPAAAQRMALERCKREGA